MDHDARKTVGNGKRHDTQVVPYGAIPILCCRVEHIFDEDAVAGSGIVNQNMSVLMIPTAS